MIRNNDTHIASLTEYSPLMVWPSPSNIPSNAAVYVVSSVKLPTIGVWGEYALPPFMELDILLPTPSYMTKSAVSLK